MCGFPPIISLSFHYCTTVVESSLTFENSCMYTRTIILVKKESRLNSSLFYITARVDLPNFVTRSSLILNLISTEAYRHLQPLLTEVNKLKVQLIVASSRNYSSLSKSFLSRPLLQERFCATSLGNALTIDAGDALIGHDLIMARFSTSVMSLVSTTALLSDG